MEKPTCPQKPTCPHIDLDFQPPDGENISICYLSYLVCGAVSWQPKDTNTAHEKHRYKHKNVQLWAGQAVRLSRGIS